MIFLSLFIFSSFASEVLLKSFGEFSIEASGSDLVLLRTIDTPKKVSLKIHFEFEESSCLYEVDAPANFRNRICGEYIHLQKKITPVYVKISFKRMRKLRPGEVEAFHLKVFQEKFIHQLSQQKIKKNSISHKLTAVKTLKKVKIKKDWLNGVRHFQVKGRLFQTF